jgi:RNA polymerase-binding transcription factor DksA
MGFINMAPIDAHTYWMCEKCGATIIAYVFCAVPQHCQICNVKCKQITPDKYFELNPTINKP